MTLNPLIQKYRIKQLETAFKRSSSLIQQALNNTAIEYGYNSFKDFNSICVADGIYLNQCQTWRSQNLDLITDINNTFLSNFKDSKPITKKQKGKLNKMYIKAFSGKTSVLKYTELYGFGEYNTPNGNLYYLNDGSTITSLTFFYHELSDGISFTFDTNGPDKGPNRYGYDIFIFTSGRWNLVCSINGGASHFNGRGCYNYALRNENPDDKTKGYWESLKL